MDYILEVGDWCDRGQRPPLTVHADTDEAAIAHAETALGDPYVWAALPAGASTWAWPDGRTLRGWNYTSDAGTYQLRLRRQ
jgi:hypothetical protein